MNASAIRKDEQIKLIMECRRSGLTDSQWCNAHGICPSTFYNWVSKLKKGGYSFSDMESKNTATFTKQEVVKVDLIKCETSSPSELEQNARVIHTQIPPSLAAEIEVGTITLRVFNGADPLTIENMLKCIGGASHAW